VTATSVDKLAATHERLLAAVDGLVDGDGWQTLLRVTARVHSYSPSNLILIASQRPDASCVHGYKEWQKRGRQVRKGERGIAILAPRLTRRPVSADTADSAAAGQRLGEVKPEDDRDGPSRPIVTGFAVVHVWDITQTDGPPIDVASPRQLDGAAPLGVFADLLDRVEAAGYSFGYLDVTPANGRTDFTDRSVVVRPGMSGAQTVKTLAHELAHVLLHDPASVPAGVTRAVAEVEAESVAYIVTAAHGLAADDYTVPYVAAWAGGNRELIAATAGRVLDCARGIFDSTPTDDGRNLEASPRSQVLDNVIDLTAAAVERSAVR
jgi:hypothetical protein